MIVIYKITNVINNKVYIGSTSNFAVRSRTHINELNKNIHNNPKLQNSWNKYGQKNFRFEIVEYDVKDQYGTEQSYLDVLSLNKDTCYNLSFVANGGGADTNKIKSYVLDLSGNILTEHEGVYEAFKSINAFYHERYNTKAIVVKKYRIVSKDFYINNQDVISKWDKQTKRDIKAKNHSDKKKLKSVFATIDGIEYEFKTLAEAAKFVGITSTSVRLMINRIIKNRYNFRQLKLIDDCIWDHR